MAICLDAAAAAAGAAIVPRPKWLTQLTRRLTNWSTVERTGRQTKGQRQWHRETNAATDRLLGHTCAAAPLNPAAQWGRQRWRGLCSLSMLPLGIFIFF